MGLFLLFWYFLVLGMRLELTCLAAPPPQDGASTNFATPARFSVIESTRGKGFCQESKKVFNRATQKSNPRNPKNASERIIIFQVIYKIGVLYPIITQFKMMFQQFA
jgi:hypothetical protein